MAIEKEYREVDIRSEEVQEVLNHVPNSLIRWGTSVFFGILLVLICLSIFVRYPDIIVSKVAIVSNVPPAHLIAKVSGPVQLLVKDQENVAKGSILGYVESTANVPDVVYLSAWIDSIENTIEANTIGDAINIKSKNLGLGEIQNAYMSFIGVASDLQRFNELQIMDNQRDVLLQNIKQMRLLDRELHIQSRLYHEEYQIAQAKFVDDSLLYSQQVLNKHQFYESKREYLNSRYKLQDINLQLVENRIQSGTIQAQSNEVLLTKIKEEEQLREDLLHAFKQLKVKIEEWKYQYMLISPLDGQVSFSRIWSNNQFVSMNQEVMSVIPKSEKIIGKLEVPVAGSGKIAIGQEVRIKLNNYPFGEYGMLRGRVETMSLVPTNNVYFITIALTNGLTSTYNQQLTFQQEMSGTAEIITEDKRLIHRFLYQLMEIFDEVYYK